MTKPSFRLILGLTLGFAPPLWAEMPNDAEHSFYSYLKGQNPASTNPENPEVIEGTLSSTMNAAGYTYMEIEAGKKDKVWLATRQVSVKKGDAIAFPRNEPFTDFHSKTLNRTFPRIYFVAAVAINGQVVDTTAGDEAEGGAVAAAPTAKSSDKVAAKAPPTLARDEKKPAATDVKSLANLLSRRRDYNGKAVSLRGRVVKINAGIMGRNWIHIVDDSLNAKTQDITITTEATANLGDHIQVTGVVAADKDIGSGYSFPVLVENATLRSAPK